MPVVATPVTTTPVTTQQLADRAGVSRMTVVREIERGNLEADRVGHNWLIQPGEAGRWEREYRPYAGLRRPRGDREEASAGDQPPPASER